MNELHSTLRHGAETVGDGAQHSTSRLQDLQVEGQNSFFCFKYVYNI